MITSEWSSLAGRSLFTVAASAGGDDVAQETAQSLAAALDAIAGAGFRPEHIVRSRLFTRDSESRQRASDVRRALLAGGLRGASSSFWDPSRLCEGRHVRLELTAMAAPDAGPKEVVEYEPVIAPPKYVRLGGLVFLSGITDVTPGVSAQVPAIRASVDASLAAAGLDLRAARLMSVFLAREEDPRSTLALIGAHFAEAKCTVTLTQVGGYSEPRKRIEIEVTASEG